VSAEFSIEEQISCVKREIIVRERVYPRWVSNGNMSQNKADSEIACMKAVLETLGRVQDASILAAGRLVRG